MQTSYWNSNGNHQDLVTKLNTLMPVMGSVEKPWKNKNLERFRKASNAYYDIFNNGGMNRGKSIAKIFGSGVTHCLRRTRDHRGFHNTVDSWNQIYLFTEPKMDAIVLAAAREQGLI